MSFRPLLALVLAGLLAVQVEAQTSPSPPLDQVTLKSGDVLRGRLKGSTDEAVTFEHPELGVLTIAKDRIASFGPLATSLPAQATGSTESAEGTKDSQKTASSATAEASASPEQAKKSPWDFFLGFAVSGTWNVNDETSVRASGGAKYEEHGLRLTLDAAYYFRVYNGANSDNNLLINGLEELTLGESSWLLFAQQQYQYDEFQAWENRVSLYFGPGYRLIKNDAMDLTLRAGFGATYEAGGVDDWSAEALLAEEFNWRISKRQKLMVNSSIAPELANLASYRLQFAAEYSLAIDESKKGLAVTFGVRDIFDSQPQPDSSSNDLRAYAGMRYDW
ncbi:MAG: DUF481 domain-containing protein [Phycisphaerales bacterium]